MYDFERSSNYDLNNCKHLACTEVRAANFNTKCSGVADRRLPFGRLMKVDTQRLEASDFCLKDLAIEHLREREKCADKADRYVNYVFEKCKNDRSPFAGGSAGGISKNVSNII